MMHHASLVVLRVSSNPKLGIMESLSNMIYSTNLSDESTAYSYKKANLTPNCPSKYAPNQKSANLYIPFLSFLLVSV